MNDHQARGELRPELVIMSPAMVGLPLLDRGHAESGTMALVDRVWPEIEASIEGGDLAGALDRMAALALGMWQTTGRDPGEWSQALHQSRALLYDAMVAVAEAGGLQREAAAALDACCVWDSVHRSGLIARRASLEGGPGGKRP
jgi:hypothetical protein